VGTGHKEFKASFDTRTPLPVADAIDLMADEQKDETVSSGYGKYRFPELNIPRVDFIARCAP
jgi:hypothetical protein